MAFKVIGHQHLIIISLFDYSESSNITQISGKHSCFHVATSKLLCADFNGVSLFARIEQPVALPLIIDFLATTFRKSEKAMVFTYP